VIPELHDNLVDYIGKHVILKKVAAHEWAGPCPVCGGRDRFRVSDRGWFCRKCTGEKWGDLADFTKLAFGWTLRDTLKNFNLDRRASPEELASLEAERKRREDEQRRAEQEAQALVHAQLTSSPDWWTYYQNVKNIPEARAMWNKRGLSDTWIDYYRLGYCPARRFTSGDEHFDSASLTIPYFRPTFTQNPEGGADVTWQVVQMKHRLLSDDTPGGKYRPHMAGAGNHLFYTDLHQRNVYGDLLIVEGEIKAMVTWAAMWAGEDCLFPNLTVIGIPGQSWRTDFLDQFNLADRVFICLDPDATSSARKLAERIGDKAKVLLLPDKIDDLLNIGVLDGFKLFELMVR